MATIEIELLPSGSSLDPWKVAGADPRDIPAKPLPERFDRARRQDLCATVRNALGECDAMTGLRAVRTLAAMRSHPDYVQGRADHLAIVSDGTMTPFPAVPEPFTTRQHESKPRRSRKGRSTFDLVRGHDAQVIGDIRRVTRPYDASADDAISTIDRGYLEAHLSTVPRKGYGRSGLGVLRVTDYRLSAYGVPALLGSEIPGRRHGNAWATIIPGDRSSQCSVAIHRTDLMGGEVPSHLARFAALRDVYATDTPTSGASRVARFPLSRLKLRKLRARRTDPSVETFVKSDGKTGARFVPTITHTLATPDRFNRDGLGYARCFVTTTRYVMPTDRIPVRWCSLATVHECDHRCTIHLATIPPETLWLGHECVARGMTTRQAREATSARKRATTIGTVEAPSSLEAWTVLLDCVNRGERVVTVYPDGTRRTITRQAGDAGVYSTGSGRARIQARSAEAMALRLI